MSRRFARPYAKAVLRTAGSDDAAKAVRTELQRYLEVAAASPELGKMSASPAVPLEVKQKILAEICQMLEIGALSKSLLDLLMKNYRLIHLDAVLTAIDQLLNRRLGVVVAEVTSAKALDEDQRERLGVVLRKILDQEIDLTLKTDPKLLGGFVARIGSYRYDASLVGQLDRLAGSLTHEN